MRVHRASLVVVLILLAGCSGDDKWKQDRPKTVPAEGTITLNGKPLEDATIVLTSDSNGCSGKSDKEGKFKLEAFSPDPGAVPGSYKVMITKAEYPLTPDPSEKETNKPIYAKLLVPKKYTSPETSGLTVDIPETGKTDIKLELKD